MKNFNNFNKMKKILFFLVLTLLHFSCDRLKNNSDKQTKKKVEVKQPNILFAISDDQSYPHASAYGCKFVNTPAFDRVASEGVLFNNAFSASPGCAPSRAALLTGKNDWQIEQAGTHASSFPLKYTVYPDILESAGYFVGYTRKGWGPGNWEISGRTRNPAGNPFNSETLEPPFNGIANNDYSANFAEFLGQRPEGQPFCFWYGASEPHRVFEKGSGLKSGKRLEDVDVPDFLPDTKEVRSDLLDYAVEIEWFDKHLGEMIQMLEVAGELDNTIVVVTSDNGMAFPRAKANLYEYGIHVPMAIMWGDRIAAGQVIDEPVNLIDLAPTYLAVAENGKHQLTSKYPMEGRNLLPVLLGEDDWEDSLKRKEVYAARERHSSSRWNNLTYPQRAVRTDSFLYIRNFKPERWPAGAPQKYESEGELGPMHGGYHDIDACPTLDFLIENREEPGVSKYFHLAVDKRPGEELFDIINDPGCLNNLVIHPNYAATLNVYREKLGGYLMKTGDPRVTGNGDIYETYVRYSHIRHFPKPDWLKNSPETYYCE